MSDTRVRRTRTYIPIWDTFFTKGAPRLMQLRS